ncbi:hypothetical protein [Enterovibrio norvegicus]|uniref:hypothetical protein n=1 Tax=Enterovibrio norvegicus TaxID=188144 RepID=UPI000C822B95|nr:hypothetical protein [Enterovibrio norvegicus]PMN66212.1 hypothetical protein BCT27_24615 [Enterovibrio norvegicus]
MSFGTFYRVEDKVREAFVGKISKSEWYDVLGEIEIQSYESCDAEESIPAWVLALKKEEAPLNLLFQGELRAEQNEYDDPDVVFLGKNLIRSIVLEIGVKGRPYFQTLLQGVNCLPDFWLFDSMFTFLNESAEKDEAVIIMWGG